MSDWKSDLAITFNQIEQINRENEEKLKLTQGEITRFYSEVVVPALQELKTELEKYQRKVKVTTEKNSAAIEIEKKGELELIYSIKVRILPDRTVPYPETRYRDKLKNKSYRAEGKLRYGKQDYDISLITKDEIIYDFLSHYIYRINLP